MTETEITYDALPAGFLEAEGLFWNNKYVGNFLPHVECSIESNDDGAKEIMVRIKCKLAGGTESDIKTIRLSDLDTIKWSDLDINYRLSPDCSKAQKYLAAIIRAEIPGAPVEKEYLISREGMHFVEGKPVFCAGDELILSPDINKNISLKLEYIPKKLAIDDNCTEQQAIIGAMKVVNLSPNAGRIILAHCLLNIMRSVYAEVYKVPRCIVFLEGLTGTKKTTFASHITQMYDRDKGIASPHRLDSSGPAFEQILYDSHDSVVILDDLFPAKSSETKRKQEKTLNDLVRIIGDSSGRAIKKGNSVIRKTPRSGAMITGEYLVGTGSDAARLLPITFTTPIENSKLTECQNEPLIISTFYKFFIEWFIKNYDVIRELLAKLLLESRSTHMGVHDRLQETHFYLGSAYNIFLQYCIEKRFTTLNNAKNQNHTFQNLLTALVKKQDKRVRMTSDSESLKTDYLSIIKILLKGRILQLADDIESLKEKHHGLVHGDCLCLRGIKLMPEIRKFVPNANLNSVIDSLLEQKALQKGNNRSSIQISGGGGVRFLAIPLKKLK